MATGPRQSGKATLCRGTFASLEYVSLEPLDVREFAATDSRGFLARYRDGAVLDEVEPGRGARLPDRAGRRLGRRRDQPHDHVTVRHSTHAAVLLAGGRPDDEPLHHDHTEPTNGAMRPTTRTSTPTTSTVCVAIGSRAPGAFGALAIQFIDAARSARATVAIGASHEPNLALMWGSQLIPRSLPCS
jgi:hypothetical protein